MFEKHRKPNGNYDGPGVMSELTGLSRQSMVELAAKVQENHAKLRACRGHSFAPADGPFQRRRVCSACGGEADSVSVSWYEEGRQHALLEIQEVMHDVHARTSTGG